MARGAALAPAPAVRRLTTIFLLSLGVVACSGGGCGPDLDLDLGGPDQCEPAGGECWFLGCGVGRHPTELTGCFLGVCCVPGAACAGRCASSCGAGEARAGGFCRDGEVCCKPTAPPLPEADGATPLEDASASGFCNLTPCAAGCTCRARAEGDAGACEAVCVCPTDAGADAGGDGSADAGDDAGAEGGLDAALEAGLDDAGDAGATETCGVIACTDGCGCYDDRSSECACPVLGCEP